jgi:hypothetical protein
MSRAEIKSVDDLVRLVKQLLKGPACGTLEEVTGSGSRRTVSGSKLIVLVWAGITEPALSTLERLAGSAVPGRRTPVLVSVTPPVGRAREFADEAEIALIDVRLDGSIKALNAPAEALLQAYREIAEFPIPPARRWNAEEREAAAVRLETSASEWTTFRRVKVESSDKVHLARESAETLCGIRRSLSDARSDTNCRLCAQERTRRAEYAKSEIRYVVMLRSDDPLAWLHAQDYLWDEDEED